VLVPQDFGENIILLLWYKARWSRQAERRLFCTISWFLWEWNTVGAAGPVCQWAPQAPIWVVFHNADWLCCSSCYRWSIVPLLSVPGPQSAVYLMVRRWMCYWITIEKPRGKSRVIVDDNHIDMGIPTAM